MKIKIFAFIGIIVAVLGFYAIAILSDNDGSENNELQQATPSTKRPEGSYYVSIAKDGVNVRTGPGTEFPVFMELYKGYPLLAIEEKQNGWLKVRDFEGDGGWLYHSLANKSSTVIVNTSKRVNLFAEPGKNFKSIATVESGVVFDLIERKKKWVKVRSRDGFEGWIYSALVWPSDRLPSNISFESKETESVSSDKYFGCSSLSLFEKITEYAAQRDKKAFEKALSAAMLVGDCTDLKYGEKVFISDTAVFSGLVKIRRPGELIEFWTVMEAVQ